MCQFVQAGVQHTADKVGSIVLYQISHITLLVVGGSVVFVEYEHLNMRLFLILFDNDDRFFVVIYRIIDTFGCIGLCRDIGKHCFDFGFHCIYVDITYDNDAL